MDNETTVPQPNISGQDVTVELTPLFADDNALRAAYTEALSEGVSPDAIVKGWCRIAKLALQTGEYTKHTGKINNVNRRVPINSKVYSTVAFRVLENAGMVVATDKKAVANELTDKDFEDWWKFYPARQSNGKPVKVGKADAKRVFVNTIRTRSDYEKLTHATESYTKVTKPQFVKDAVRFLRNDFWRDFLPAAFESAVADEPVKEVTDRDALNKMMGVVNDESVRHDAGTTPAEQPGE